MTRWEQLEAADDRNWESGWYVIWGNKVVPVEVLVRAPATTRPEMVRNVPGYPPREEHMVGETVLSRDREELERRIALRVLAQ